MASAPPCVSATPTFGLASVSVLCAGQEGAGRWCWTVVAVPLSHAPWLVHVEDGITGCKRAAAAPLSPRCTKKRPGAPHNHRAWGFAGSPGVTFRSSSHCERVISCNSPRTGGRGESKRWTGSHVSLPLLRSELARLGRPKEPPAIAWPPGDHSRLPWLLLAAQGLQSWGDLAVPLPPFPEFSWESWGQETRACAQLFFTHSVPQSLLPALGTSWGVLEGSGASGDKFDPERARKVQDRPSHTQNTKYPPSLSPGQDPDRGIAWSGTETKRSPRPSPFRLGFEFYPGVDTPAPRVLREPGISSPTLTWQPSPLKAGHVLIASETKANKSNGQLRPTFFTLPRSPPSIVSPPLSSASAWWERGSPQVDGLEGEENQGRWMAGTFVSLCLWSPPAW